MPGLIYTENVSILTQEIWYWGQTKLHIPIWYVYECIIKKWPMDARTAPEDNGVGHCCCEQHYRTTLEIILLLDLKPMYSNLVSLPFPKGLSNNLIFYSNLWLIFCAKTKIKNFACRQGSITFSHGAILFRSPKPTSYAIGRVPISFLY